MASFIPDTVTLQEGKSSLLFVLGSRVAGTFTQPLETQGRDLISSVYVKSSDPGMSVKVNYFDTSSGTNQGERYDLSSHNALTDANVGDTDRITVTKIHHKPICEVVVTGAGSIEFGVYVTVREESAIVAEFSEKSPSGFVTEEFDYVALTYVASGNGVGEIETATYKIDGASGTTVATLTIAYDASNRITTVTKT